MSKHTPGPWKSINLGYEDHPIYIDTTIRKKDDPTFHGSTGAIAKIPKSKFHNIEANAHLIAAAPELLEALIKARNLIEISVPFEGPVTRKIDAAIAKARGEA